MLRSSDTTTPRGKISREKRLLNYCRLCFEKRNIKELNPYEILNQAIDDCGDKLTVGWSGGKCSTIVLHMILQIKPNIDVHYTNTGIEFPENNDYVNKLSKLWNLNLTILHPTTTFWEVVKKYGFPKFRVLGSDVKYARKRHRTPRCCYYLKEKPRFQYYKEHNILGDISGLRACESRVRAIHIGMRSQIYSIKHPKPMTIYVPIALWTNKQCKEYISKNNIPHNHTYDTQQRNGCWACTGYKGWKKNIMKYNPKMYKMIQKIRGVHLMDDYIPNLTPCDVDY